MTVLVGLGPSIYSTTLPVLSQVGVTKIKHQQFVELLRHKNSTGNESRGAATCSAHNIDVGEQKNVPVTSTNHLRNFHNI